MSVAILTSAREVSGGCYGLWLSERTVDVKVTSAAPARGISQTWLFSDTRVSHGKLAHVLECRKGLLQVFCNTFIAMLG